MALENHSCVRLEDNNIDTCYLCYLNGYWPWNPTALESSTILRRVHQVQTTELNWGCTCALSELYSDIAETSHQGKGQSSESRVGVPRSVQNTNSQALGSYYLRAPEVTLPCLDLYHNELKMPKSFLLKRRSHNGADREDNFKDELVKKVKSTSMTDKKQQLIFSTTLPYYDQGPVLHIHPYPPSPLSPYRPYDAGRTFLFHPALQDLRHTYALPSYERPFLQSHFQDSLTRNFQPLPVIPKRESDFHPFLFKEKSEKHSERELSFSNKRVLFPLLDHDDGDYRQDPLKCEQCGKTFKTKYTLAIHMRMPSHTNARPFVCGVCGKGFRLSSTLCRHKIIHTSERPHKCHLCDKAFNRSSTLKTHIRTHSESKEYTCETCGKGFHQKGNLRNHTLIHTGEKPYKCRLCEKAFNKLSNLKFHMHVHTDNSPYRCRFCKVSFTRRCDLRSHIANVHEKV